MGYGEERQVRCTCGHVMGEIVAIESIELLAMGSVLVKSIAGFCTVCGAQFYWHASDRVLGRLIDRVTKNRERM